MKVAIYGAGHLADALRGEVRAQPALAFDLDAPLAFAAQDVTDHGDPAQMLAAFTAVERAAAGDREAVAVLSQVPPGWTRKTAAGREPLIFYQVDTIIVRSAVARMVRPEQIIVGCADPSAPLPITYQAYLALHACPVLQMSYESAELAKCAINYVLTKQIEAANALAAAADLCGASYADVRRALHNDARIGPRAYLEPGAPNQHLARDVTAIQNLIGCGPYGE